MKLPPIGAVDRESFILSRVRGKTALHVGCGDWPFTEERIATGHLLHKNLNGAASRLVGVDLEPQAIQLLRGAGFVNLHVANSELPLFETVKERFDVVIAGEILEHVQNSGLFLDSLKSVCHEQSLVIITTPNFAPLKRLPRLLWKSEPVHPDHVCYYSYATLTRLFKLTGYEPLEWAAYWRDVGSISRAANELLRRLPLIQYYADGFCVVCRPKST